MDNAYDPNWLTKAMKAGGFGVSELAALAGVSRSQIQRIRNGMAPRMNTQARLQAALSARRPARAKRKLASSASQSDIAVTSAPIIEQQEAA